MMILYEKTESNFNHNGLAVLDGVVVSPWTNVKYLDTK